MLLKRAFIVKLGGTAEVDFQDFCPLWGQKSFLFMFKTFTKERLVYDD